ncbi:Zinc finger HIT domain-containing protein 2 [Linum grandiflorum]
MEQSIITSEKASQPSPLDPPSRIICHVCQKQFSQYTCPRCNSRYCSLQCYKSHSVRCTESFMRENVVGELKHLKTGDESKRKMMDILKRVHSEEEKIEAMDDDDGDDSFLSEQTLEKIASGDEITIDDLSTEEKKRFSRAVACGELSKFFKPWDPWWLKSSATAISLSKVGTPLVQPIINDQPSSSLQEEIPPGPDAPLQPVSNLIAKEPSPLLSIHLVDIIYSYCFTLRLYNGDWKSDAVGSVTVLLSLSRVLSQSSQPENVMEALSYCLEQSCSPEYRHVGGSRFGISIVDDVATMLALGRGALICMLADVQRLVQAAEEAMKAEKSVIKSKLKLAERKVYFFMCWVNEEQNGHEGCWNSLAAIVKTEKSCVLDHCKVDVKSRGKTEETRGKVFVEEMK